MPEQEADLRAEDGSVMRVRAPAFPDHEEMLVVNGRYFVADSPVIGFGRTALSYHEVQPYAIAQVRGEK